jgi:hypothetical protein
MWKAFGDAATRIVGRAAGQTADDEVRADREDAEGEIGEAAGVRTAHATRRLLAVKATCMQIGGINENEFIVEGSSKHEGLSACGRKESSDIAGPGCNAKAAALRWLSVPAFPSTKGSIESNADPFYTAR